MTGAHPSPGTSHLGLSMTLSARGLAVTAVAFGALGLAVPVGALPAASAVTVRTADDVPAAQSAPEAAPEAAPAAQPGVAQQVPVRRAPSGSTDPALLIGVGVAALAGAGGLFAAAAHAARRA